ncbi:hypothetical protein WG219_10315 [Ectopseudomonas mendocina]|uniref:Uncharacterized protein n=1 Tax=Ectopseudomonas mendocina TaxID=300 RepID=A0ABZ2RLE4_ECTME
MELTQSVIAVGLLLSACVVSAAPDNAKDSPTARIVYVQLDDISNSQ